MRVPPLQGGQLDGEDFVLAEWVDHGETSAEFPTAPLHSHDRDDEAWYVLEGRAQLELGAPGERMLNMEVVGPGAAFHFPPGTVHRVTALEDTRIVEVSTPQLEDIVRLDDLYGRTEPGSD